MKFLSVVGFCASYATLIHALPKVSNDFVFGDTIMPGLTRRYEAARSSLEARARLEARDACLTPCYETRAGESSCSFQW
jgi:hypothetical protein